MLELTDSVSMVDKLKLVRHEGLNDPTILYGSIVLEAEGGLSAEEIKDNLVSNCVIYGEDFPENLKLGLIDWANSGGWAKIENSLIEIEYMKAVAESIRVFNDEIKKLIDQSNNKGTTHRASETTSPEVKRKKRKQQLAGFATGSEVDNQSDVPDSEPVSEGGRLSASRKDFPWSDRVTKSGEVQAIRVVGRANWPVVVLDCRPTQAVGIEQSNFNRNGNGQSADIKGLNGKVDQVLRYIAEGIASSDKGNIGNIKTMGSRDTENYPLPIRYYSGDDGLRVYFSVLKVSELKDKSLRERLTTAGIEKVVAYIGACNKSGQIRMLELLTGASREELRAGRAGTARARAR